MNRDSIPRKHKKHVKRIIEDYKTIVHPGTIKSLKDYIMFLKIGAEDGWLKTNNREYQSIVWMDKNIGGNWDE